MPNATAGEVVKAAQAKGLKLQAGLVYAVRSAAKAKGSKAKGGRPKGSKNAPRALAARGIKLMADEWAVLHRLAMRHGLAKVEAYVQELKKSVGL